MDEQEKLENTDELEREALSESALASAPAVNEEPSAVMPEPAPAPVVPATPAPAPAPVQAPVQPVAQQPAPTVPAPAPSIRQAMPYPAPVQPQQPMSYVNPNNRPPINPVQSGYYNPAQQTAPAVYRPAGEDNNDKKKKSKAPIIIAIVLGICLIVAVVGMIIAIGNKGNNNNATTTPDSETTTTQFENDPDGANAEFSDSEDVPLVAGDGDTYTVAGVADVAMDSCVGITVYAKQSSYYSFYGYGTNEAEEDGYAPAGEGSGVIMSESSGKTYILTAAHVISDADKFKVTLNDDTEYDANMVGYDAQTDIGVLEIDATGLKVAQFADSDKVVVGEQVVAIGCPGGLEFKNSVTSGYVSALDRPVSSSIGYNNYCIQTDAAINPGNSGGALFNMQGQVIGINSSKIASTEYEGMGFSVPSKTAVDTANSLIKVGYVAGRAKIGVTYNLISNYSNADRILEALRQKGYDKAEGLMVIERIESESDLNNRGVEQYDMIIAVEGKTMTSVDVMTSTLSAHKPGDTIKLTIARVEGNDITIKEIECKLIEATND